MVPAGSEPGTGGAAGRAGAERRRNRRTNGAAALLSLSSHIAFTRYHPLAALSLQPPPPRLHLRFRGWGGGSYVRDLPHLHNSLPSPPPRQRLQHKTPTNNDVEQQPPSPRPSVGAGEGVGGAFGACRDALAQLHGRADAAATYSKRLGLDRLPCRRRPSRPLRGTYTVIVPAPRDGC